MVWVALLPLSENQGVRTILSAAKKTGFPDVLASIGRLPRQEEV